LTGVGFGNQFINAVPLPDISFFQWWQYMTHNSIIYIWMKAGFGGFLALLVLVGLAIMTGMRVLLRMPQGGLRAAALLAILYVAMHFVYAYVDLSWDSQSMLYVGAMLGLINVLEHLVAKPVPVPAKRWPWQPDPDPAPGLQPLPGD
jgi:O-antigen ligase